MIKKCHPNKNRLRSKQSSCNYQFSPSFLSHLPWVEFDDANHCILLQDKTVCAAFEMNLLASETKPEAILKSLRNNLQGLFQDTFPMYETKASPWIMQWYVEDLLSMQSLYQQIMQYIQPPAQSHSLTESYLTLMKAYSHWLTQPEGVFFDDKVTHTVFRGHERVVRLVIYRQFHKKMALPRGRSAVEDLNQVATRLVAKLTGIGIKVKRLDGQAFRNWLIRWFNPSPAITGGDVEKLIQSIPYPTPEQQPFGYDFTEQLFYATPQSDAKQGVWYFDQRPHCYLPIEQLARVPKLGQVTRECPAGNYRYSLFDQFPRGTIFVLTVVLTSQAEVNQQLDRVEWSARKSASMAAELTFEDCQQAKRAIEQHNYLFPTSMGVYCQGENLTDLRDQTTALEALLTHHGFHLLHQDHNLVPLHHYLHYLPGNYRYDFDKKYLSRSQYVFGKQLANLLPLYGRERGTGHPLLQFLNRGGESLTIDPFHPADKDNNSHLLMLGSTGSGKSATSTDLLIKLMATYRPYLVMIDAGNSFHLLKDYFIEQGLSVHHVAVTLANPPILNPFAESEVMLNQIDLTHATAEQALQQLDTELVQTIKEEPATRDYLGEMALSCQLMITGGEAKEQAQLTRQDRLLILNALIETARRIHHHGQSQMIASDIVETFRQMAIELEQQQSELTKAVRLRTLADSLAFFTQDTLAHQVFNRRGDPWPDADVILFEQGIFKDEGYEAHNALAFMGLMSRTMAKAEARQFEERFTVLYGDEIHTLTKNLLTVVYLTKCAKMSRKFGLWLWLATQNVADFPQEAKKMLSMMEFWLCLGTSAAEIEAIETFRPLSEEERLLFQSVRKAAKKYVEGVLLCPRMKTLFRNVPPRLSLALAMTEKHEKAERKKLMDQYNLSELEAAKRIAETLQHATND